MLAPFSLVPRPLRCSARRDYTRSMRRVVRLARFVVVQVIIVAVLLELTVRVLRPFNADVDRVVSHPTAASQPAARA